MKIFDKIEECINSNLNRGTQNVRTISKVF